MVILTTLIGLALALTVVAWRLRAPVAAAFLLAAFGGMAVAVTENLSRPKPVGWESRWGIKEVELLWWRLVEGTGIYTVALLPEEPEPRYYVMPWSRELADRLTQLRDKQEKGHRVMVPWPFQPSLEFRTPLVLHDLPPPALPPKAGADRPAPRTEEM